MTPDRGTITQWLDEASSGLDAAFERLARAVQDDLYRFALAHGLARDDAAEATQETLLRAYRLRRKWRAGTDAMTWLYGIAMNVVREFGRRNRRGRASPIDLEALCVAPGGGPADDDDGLPALATAIEQLPARQREAVVCRYLRRMSVRETAGAMGCAEGTVKAAVAAALATLRETMNLRPMQPD